MSNYQDIINDTKESLRLKKEELKAVKNMLLLSDAQIDKYDILIRNIDKSALPFIKEVNDSIEEVKAAYDARIAAGCRNSLSWELEKSKKVKGILGLFEEYQLETFTVKNNPDTTESIPFVGIKYYQSPSDRDYGANIIAEFVGDVSYGSTGIVVTSEDGVPSDAQIGDVITDSVDSPSIFSISNLPNIVSIGTTQILGITTTLVGGISTGSTIFASFEDVGVTTSINLGSIIERTGIVTASIVGFGTTTVETTFYDVSGIFTTGIVTATALFLSTSSAGYADNAPFTVYDLQTKPLIGLSTSANSGNVGSVFTIIRQEEVERKKKDFTKSPHAPLRISVVESSSIGAGHSASFDESGDSNEKVTWNPNKSYYDPVDEKIVKPEPNVGAGKVTYNVGNFAWPTLISCTQIGPNLVCTSSYAPEGTSISVGGTDISASTGTTPTSPQNPSNSLCNQLDSAITEKVNLYNSIRSKNVPKIKGLVAASKTLRQQRYQKQIYAWSLLQAQDSIQNDIIDLEDGLDDLEKIDFSEFDV
jgi:hypothetical protein